MRSSRFRRSQRRSGPRSDEGGVRVVATVRPRVGGKNEDGAIFAASWVAARPARVRRRRLPDTSATRLHATRVPFLRARVAPRPYAAAKRTGGEATHRASLLKPARDVPDRIRASLADPSRLPDPRLEAVRGTCHAVRHSEETSLTSAPNAREWKCRGSRSRAQSGTAVFSVSWMSRHESSRGAARPKKANPDRKARHNGTALLPLRRGGRGEKWHELPSQYTSCVSRRDCRRRTARASTTTRRARNRTRLLFRHIPCSGHRAESVDPSVPRRRVETTRATPRRASGAGDCSRLFARASSATDGLRLERLEPLLEARSS